MLKRFRETSTVLENPDIVVAVPSQPNQRTMRGTKTVLRSHLSITHHGIILDEAVCLNVV